MSTVIVPAAPGVWSDTAAVFEGKGDPGTCWCQWFIDKSLVGATEEARDALRAQVDTQHPEPGLIAYDDGVPAGWVQVGARERFPSLVRSRGEAPPDTWELTCFVVRVGHRRRGLSSALLDAAVGHARAHGATRLWATPRDTEGARRRSADLFHGVLSTFAAAGFQEEGRNGRAVRVSLAL